MSSSAELFGNEIDHIADIVQVLELTEIEFDVEMLFDRRDQSDVAERIPILDRIGIGLALELNRIVNRPLQIRTLIANVIGRAADLLQSPEEFATLGGGD